MIRCEDGEREGKLNIFRGNGEKKKGKEKSQITLNMWPFCQEREYIAFRA